MRLVRRGTAGADIRYERKRIIMRMLLSVSIALAGGLMMTRVFKMLHLNFPDVTAFLIAGLIVGPFGIGRLGVVGIGFPTVELVEQVSALSNVALGFIAFAIGSEFRLEELKKTGRQATIVGIFQAVMATALVDAALIGLHFVLGEEVLPMPVAITMGAIAAATAPAAEHRPARAQPKAGHRRRGPARAPARMRRAPEQTGSRPARRDARRDRSTRRGCGRCPREARRKVRGSASRIRAGARGPSSRWR